MDALGVRDILSLLGSGDAWLGLMEGGGEIIQTDFPRLLADYRDGLCE